MLLHWVQLLKSLFKQLITWITCNWVKLYSCEVTFYFMSSHLITSSLFTNAFGRQFHWDMAHGKNEYLYWFVLLIIMRNLWPFLLWFYTQKYMWVRLSSLLPPQGYCSWSFFTCHVQLRLKKKSFVLAGF